jgi:WhiB family redox-sensing transcriptional regulator
MTDVADVADWRDLAACLPENPELFFPRSGTVRRLSLARRAKAVCVGCCVRQRCLGHAVDTGQVQGIWGGLSKDERRALNLAAAHGELSGARTWPRPAERVADTWPLRAP